MSLTPGKLTLIVAPAFLAACATGQSYPQQQQQPCSNPSDITGCFMEQQGITSSGNQQNRAYINQTHDSSARPPTQTGQAQQATNYQSALVNVAPTTNILATETASAWNNTSREMGCVPDKDRDGTADVTITLGSPPRNIANFYNLEINDANSFSKEVDVDDRISVKSLLGVTHVEFNDDFDECALHRPDRPPEIMPASEPFDATGTAQGIWNRWIPDF